MELQQDTMQTTSTHPEEALDRSLSYSYWSVRMLLALFPVLQRHRSVRWAEGENVCEGRSGDSVVRENESSSTAMDGEGIVRRDISSGGLEQFERIRGVVANPMTSTLQRTPRQSVDRDRRRLNDELGDLPIDLKDDYFHSGRCQDMLPDYYAQPTFVTAILYVHQRLSRTRRLQVEISQSTQNILPRVETALTSIAEEREELAIQHTAWALGNCPPPAHFWQRFSQIELYISSIVAERDEQPLRAIQLLNLIEVWLNDLEEDLFMGARVHGSNADVFWGWGFPPIPQCVVEELRPHLGWMMDE